MVRMRLATEAEGGIMSCGLSGSRGFAKKMRRNAEWSRGKKRRTGESDSTKVMRETRARFVKDYVLFIEGASFFSLHWI